MSADALQPGGLYVVLYLRDDPPRPDDFHWALYHHHGANGGRKYHIRGATGRWLPDHTFLAGIMKELFLVGLFRVAAVPAAAAPALDAALRSLDATVNDDPSVSCRVWLLRVLGLLTEAGARPAVLPPGTDLGKLEREAKDWGNAQAAAAARNEQPRPVGRSVLCGD